MSEQLLLINPRRRRRKNTRRRHRNARQSHARRHTYRNPRRRRHRNPLAMGSIKQEVTGAAIGAVGATLMDVIWGYLSLSGVLSSITGNSYLNALAKGAGAIGIGALTGKFIGREFARGATVGALTVVSYELVHNLLVTNAPSIPLAGINGLGAYMHMAPGGMGAYNPAAYLRSAPSGAQSGGSNFPGVASNPQMFGAYMQPAMAGVMTSAPGDTDGMF